ncbi:prorelaxin H1 [Diretmus argenteus]
MLLRLTLAVAAVCVCGRLKADGLSGLSRVMVAPRDYGVKLCGREFIRAVIFTCGGSRWKRSAPEDSDPFQWNSYPGITAAGNQHTWQRGVELTDEHSPVHSPSSSYSLADLLALLGGLGDTRQPLGDQTLLEKSQQSKISGEQDMNPMVDWPKPNRMKRNFSLGVAGMCCNHGCTKNDIGRLC